ncbi:MAG TPA: potassium/proton antiporter [Thermoanaerobaculia bacterium]|nr:potassium/proton antiporter [Thermoanaerobaculia bacterium]
MDPVEPTASAWLFLAIGALLLLGVLFGRMSGRLGVPAFLLFLGAGMLAGSEGLGGIAFDDYRLAFRLGTLALVLILFDGGLNTPLPEVRRAWAPATVLATVGVLGTAGLMGLLVRLLGFSWSQSLLLGAVVASTDAAAVFSVLRSSGLQLRRRVGLTLELESGLNDPMAILLTLALTAAVASGGGIEGSWFFQVPLQLAVGGAFGVGIGLAGRTLLRRLTLNAGGLYAALSMALALLAFALPTLFWGSGFLAVYVAAALIGNSRFPYRGGLLHFHDSIAWLAQIGMFLLLGLLVFPSQLVPQAGRGLVLGLVLALVARPLVVALCLLPFRYPWRESLFLSLVGLRGAVPIVLATFPVMAGVPGAENLFHLVFFVVVVNALVPGTAVAWLARRLRLVSDRPPPPKAVLEITSTQWLDGEVVSYFIRPELPVCGVPLADVPLPGTARVMLILRGNELVAPRGDTVLEEGDHVYLFCKPEDEAWLHLAFGRQEEH